MNESGNGALGRILAFAAVLEFGTGLILLLDPALVATLLLGAELSGVGVMVGRCFGIALLALGMACWPGAGSGPSAWRAMLAYNILIAVYLSYLGTDGLTALLLWPAVGLHAVVALLLVWTTRKG
jgi:hypothetical protein